MIFSLTCITSLSPPPSLFTSVAFSSLSPHCITTKAASEGREPHNHAEIHNKPCFAPIFPCFLSVFLLPLCRECQSITLTYMHGHTHTRAQTHVHSSVYAPSFLACSHNSAKCDVREKECVCVHERMRSNQHYNSPRCHYYPLLTACVCVLVLCVCVCMWEEGKEKNRSH